MGSRHSRPTVPTVDATRRLRPPSALLELTRPSNEGMRIDSIPWAAFASQDIDADNDQRPTAPAPFWLASVHGMAAYVPPVTIIDVERPSERPTISPPYVPRTTRPSIRDVRRPDARRLVALVTAMMIVSSMWAFARAFG